jgi:WhiB family transcriptional regulator, redox-sensing transcriptional regulator
MSIAASHDPALAGTDPRTEMETEPIVPAQMAWDDEDTPWEEYAACRGTDPELFFPVSTTGPSAVQIRQAKEICARCPVRQPCLAYALATGQQFGIWGGLDETERHLLRRAVPPQAARRPLASLISGPRPAAAGAAAAARPGR